ncbi:hypothetical protein ACFRMN_25700 [Streptomyces sp. NPDC056835]|uniref:hypothetical protein n=1 Tax=Streptomyces sp. NPDC056835 TaxID=3345956 RepID=UPI00367B8B66
MAITDDLRKTLTDPTPLYFAAGTADIAVEQAKKVPGLIEQLRAEAPGRFEAVRNSDPKAVQEKVSVQAKEAQATVQAKVTEVFGSLDTDLKKLGETAQDLALRSVGMAAEYAVKARETYEKVAERGEQTVRAWRGEAADEITEIAVAVEPEPTPRTAPRPAPKTETKAQTRSAVKPVVKPASRPAVKPAQKAEPKTAAAAAKKITPRKTTAKKSTPPAGK